MCCQIIIFWIRIGRINADPFKNRLPVLQRSDVIKLTGKKPGALKFEFDSFFTDL